MHSFQDYRKTIKNIIIVLECDAKQSATLTRLVLNERWEGAHTVVCIEAILIRKD
jgi:hypothetical protein